MKRIFGLSALLVLITGLLVGTGAASAESWKFGVMADTQWTAPTDPAGKNPNGVPVSIIEQLNEQFIKHGVKFVIQVGDLTENGNDTDIATRAVAAQPLSDSKIGFFPMRGNHETYAKPDGINQYGITQFRKSFPQTRGIGNTFGATNFNSPRSVSADLDGMSYSFDYGTLGNNARFVIIDDWVTPSKKVEAAGYPYGYSINDQQDWISSRLDKNTRGPGHVFVFSHQNLMGENHQDSPFTGYANANPAWQNAFFASLQLNDAGYYISGHDHIHQRSIIASPNGAFRVQELICASNSSKFYTPKTLDDAKWHGQKRAQTSLSQERYTVGFYIFTVDGPRVTVEYYSDDHGDWQSDANFPNGPGLPDTGITPTFNFVRKETWGYGLNGQEFLIPQGRSYSSIMDSFGITTARILGGTNNSKARDGSLDTKGGVGRPLTKAVNTGWTSVQSWREESRLRRVKNSDFDPASHILTLWGMADLGSDQTDAYTLSLTYDRNKMGRGGFGLAAKNERGRWVNAVDLNSGNSFKKFVAGPWKAEYALGTHGVDPKTNTAWAVINHNGEFAVGKFAQ